MKESGNGTVSTAYSSSPQKSRRETKTLHTDANDETKNACARDDILDEVGLAGTNKCSGLTVVFVVIGRFRDTVKAELAMN